MSDKRKIRFQGEELGELSIDRLCRMASRGELDHTAEFWSDQSQKWRGLAGILFDLQPSRLDEMRGAGIKMVEILGSGTDDCPECLALHGRDFPIEDAPILPPSGCTCVPWCRCVEIAKL
jgi:hypothetical protein